MGTDDMHAAHTSTLQSFLPQTLPPLTSGSSESAGHVIAIASGKGGVGKTWLSITLSHALSQKRCKTLLCDSDFNLTNVDIQLGLVPNRDMGGVLSDRYGLDDARLHYPEGNFDIVAGRSGQLTNLSTHHLSKLWHDLDSLSPSYDRVILDLGAGLDRTVRHMATQATSCLVINTDEPTALTDAYAFIKRTRMENPDANLRIVVNMADNEGQGHQTYQTLRKACQSFLKMTPELADVIVRDNKVKDAIRRQAPLLTRYPDSQAASCVKSIVRHLLSMGTQTKGIALHS